MIFPGEFESWFIENLASLEMPQYRSRTTRRRARTKEQTCRRSPQIWLVTKNRLSISSVQASARRSSSGKPSRLTVSISSSPSRMLLATPAASPSSRRARLRTSRSALSASSISQACRSALRTQACSDLGSRSITLRALWTDTVGSACAPRRCSEWPCSAPWRRRR